MGERDHYAASLKGVVLSHCQDAILVDITHRISHFNLLEAAYVVRSAFRKFPVGTIHIVAVDPEGGGHQKGIAMEFEGHYFVGPDNGCLSLIKESGLANCRIINNPAALGIGSKSFLSQSTLAPAAAFLAKGGNFNEIGEEHSMREALWGEPSYSNNSLRGVIIHIDHFGNAITNIRKSEFLKLKGEKSFQVFVRNLRLKRIVSTYADVSRGEALGIFSDNEHLEIAIREGSAQQLLGINVQDMLTIEFYE